MTMIMGKTCVFCKVSYTYKRSGSWPRSITDRRSRSATLCPDCYANVWEGIKKWCEGHAHRDTCVFVEKLFKRGLSIQAVLAVLAAIEETCTICWDGDKGCFCMHDI
jgi:hypothetical protein